jgi:hypothetical protein
VARSGTQIKNPFGSYFWSSWSMGKGRRADRLQPFADHKFQSKPRHWLFNVQVRKIVAQQQLPGVGPGDRLGGNLQVRSGGPYDL